MSDLLLVHVLVGDSDVQVGDLLELPLDGGLDVVVLLVDWLAVTYWLWELTNLVQVWSHDLGELLDNGLGGNQHGVLLDPLLDDLLVLFEHFKVFKGHGLDINSLKVTSSAFF